MSSKKSSGPEKKSGSDSVVSVNFDEVKTSCRKRFGTSDDRRLSWVLEACDVYFQKPRQNFNTHGKGRNGFKNSNGSGNKNSSSGGYLQTQKKMHRDYLNAFFNSISTGKLYLKDREPVEKMISKCRWQQGWEYESEIQRLQWPSIFDGIVLEKVVYPMKVDLSKKLATYSTLQRSRIIQNVSHKYKSSLQMHAKKSSPKVLKREWDSIGNSMKREVNNFYQKYSVKRSSIWSPFKESMEKFSTVAVWKRAMKQVSTMASNQKEQANGLNNQVVVSLYTLIQQLQKEDSEDAKGKSENEESEAAEAYVKLLQKCLLSLQESESVLAEFLKMLTTAAGEHGKTLIVAAEDQCNEINDTVTRIWTLSCEQFSIHNPIANTKPQILSSNAPRSPNSSPVGSIENELKKLQSSISTNSDTCRKSIQAMMELLKKCSNQSQLMKTVQSAQFISLAKKVRKNYSVDSMVESVEHCLRSCEKHINRYNSTSFRNVAIAIQKIDDFQSREEMNEILTGWRDQFSRAVEIRVEYSWNVRYGTSLMFQCLAALVAPDDPAVKHVLEQPAYPSSTPSKNFINKKGVKDSQSNKGSLQKSTDDLGKSGSTVKETSNRNVKSSAGAQKQGKPVANTWAAIAASPVITAKQLNDQEDMYRKRIEEIKKVAESKEKEISRLNEQNTTRVQQLSRENEDLKVELSKANKEISLLKDVLKKAESELDAQRKIQLELSEVVKELQHARTAPAVGYQPYVQPQAVMMVPTSSVVGYQQTGYQHMYMGQHQNQTESYQASSTSSMNANSGHHSQNVDQNGVQQQHPEMSGLLWER